MTDLRYDSAFPRRDAPEFCMNPSAQKQRAQGMPGARCTRSLACEIKQSTPAQSPQVQTDSTGIPRAMVLRLISCSPRRSGLFVTVVCASSRRLDAGVEASEPHDFAVRKHAPSFLAPPASTASRAASVTIAKRPSVGRDARDILLIWVRPEAKYLCAQDWAAQISLIS